MPEAERWPARSSGGQRSWSAKMGLRTRSWSLENGKIAVESYAGSAGQGCQRPAVGSGEGGDASPLDPGGWILGRPSASPRPNRALSSVLRAFPSVWAAVALAVADVSVSSDPVQGLGQG